MPKEYSRTVRLAELIQRELAQLIQQELRDPRLGMVTVSAVRISPDLAFARIYVTVLNLKDQETSIQNNLQILNKAAGYLRGLLAHRIKARIIPHLTFVYDSSVIEGTRMEALIDKAIEADEKQAKETDEQDD